MGTELFVVILKLENVKVPDLERAFHTIRQPQNNQGIFVAEIHISVANLNINLTKC